MIVLRIDNSESSISGLDAKQLKGLRSILSYQSDPKASYYSGNYNTVKYLIDAKGRFPTGLLYLVQKYLSNTVCETTKSSVLYETKDLRTVPKRQEGLFKLSLGFTPYPEQIAAAKACRTHMRGIISAPTGVGKSLICTLIINELQVPTLVVVPSLELKRQLSQSLAEAFGADKVGKGKSIRVENVDSVTQKDSAGVDCVIIDEFHHSGAKTYRKLNKKAWNKVYYKFGLTATPFRSQDNERLLLESVLSKVIYRIGYAEAVASGYIVPMEAYYYELPKTEVRANTWAGVYAELIVANASRNAAISGIMASLKQADISTLCLVKEIKHGELLAEMSDSFFAHGNNEDTPGLIKLFNATKLKSLIGTTGVLGEGVDTKPAEFVIIAGLGKSKNAFMQQVGRGFRRFEGKDSCKIILFLDRSHKWTKEHYKAQCKYLLEEYGVVPTEIKFD